MSTITAFAKRHPLITFFALEYALTWPVIPLVAVAQAGSRGCASYLAMSLRCKGGKTAVEPDDGYYENVFTRFHI